MLQNIRDNAQNWVSKTIVGLLIVSFAIWGIHAIIGTFSGEPAVAKVNGQDITQEKFQQAVELQKQRELSQMKDPDPASIDMPKLKKAVLNGLIEQTALYQDARNQGLDLTKNDLDNIIKSVPEFQKDGKFSEQAFMDTVRNMGLTVGGVRDLVKRQYLINQIRAGIMVSSFTTPAEIQDLLRLQKQERSFSVLTLPQTLVKGQIKVTDAEIQKYYDSHKSGFMKPESVNAAYVELNAQNLKSQVTVTDQELHNLYQQKMADYKAHQERRAAQILIADKGSEEAVKAKLKMIQKKLDEGESFATLARKYSDDALSAKQGGDLGFAPKGTYGPAFEKALFSMKKGQVKGPIKTQYGYQFIKLLAIQSEPKPSFESMKDKLRTQLVNQKVNQIFAKKLSTLKDKAFTAYDLQEPAKDLGLQVQVVKGVTRQGGPAPFDHPGLVKALFSDDVLNNGNNTDVIQLGDNDVVVARVRKHFPPKEMPLSAVRDKIRGWLHDDQLNAALKKKADDLIDQAKKGQTLAQVAQSVGGQWQDHDKVTRNNGKIDPKVVQRAFSMPRPAKDQPSFAVLETNSGVDLVALKSVTEPDLSKLKADEQNYRRFLAQQQGRREYIDYTDQVKAKADVERF